jgi:preprotein translocase subunit SecB
MAPDSDNPAAQGDGAQAPAGAQESRLTIERIYVKDISFETPNSPSIFATEWRPSVDLQVLNDASRVDESLYEVVLRVTVTVTVGEKTAFLAEVNQAGLFGIAGVEDEGRLRAILGSHCPNILFPYVREVISDLVNRGSFPQLLLAPLNFDAIYAQHLAEQQQGQDGAHAQSAADA